MQHRDRTRMRGLAALLVIALALVSFAGAAETTAPKYIFLFIGDGMAGVQRHIAEMYLNRVEGTATDDAPNLDTLLEMNTFPVQGVATTYQANGFITDSAAAGTALASGYKTNKGYVNVGPDGETQYTTVAEMAKTAGMRVGVVSSVSIDHATPASFYAHNISRNNYYDIGKEIISSGFDFFGGGSPRWKKNPDGVDGSEANPRIDTLAEQAGMTVASTLAELQALSAADIPVLAYNPVVDGSNAMPYDIDRDPESEWSLAQFTEKAIEVLDNDNGFFLMVEGGKIDWACHANDAAATIHDTIAFDKAVEEAVEFYDQHPNETLIVVTGDHETGGLTIGFAGTGKGNHMKVLSHQKVSCNAFAEKVETWAEDVQNLDITELLAAVQQDFGLFFLSQAEMDALEQLDTQEAEEQLRRALTEYEIGLIADAFVASMYGKEALGLGSDDLFLLYGGYNDPLTTALTRIVARKAGIAWTSWEHTAVPIVTSAMGVGQDEFKGYYPNTAIATKLMSIAGFNPTSAAREME